MKTVRMLLLAAALGGCGGTALVEPRTFDLGLNAPSAPVPPVRVGFVRAAVPFESTDMHYRLAFRNAAEIAAYANSRWAASPPELLRKQLLRGAGEKAGPCQLDLEIQEFTQVFSSETASEARIELRALLSLPAGSLSRTLTVTEPGAGPDAAAGAGAFARAADRAIGEIGRWIASYKDCH